MENFTPYSATAGGMLIGISVSLLLLLNGRIAGISGILNGALYARKTERLWRLVFVLGLILGGLIFRLYMPNVYTPRANYPIALLVIGGFLVGFGTRMANGCTSGHGVCGLARFSVRSLTASITFIAFGMIAVFLVRHLLRLA